VTDQPKSGRGRGCAGTSYRRGPRFERIIAVLAERLEAARTPAPAEAARAVFAFLLGAIQDQASHNGRTPERIHEHIAALAGITPPGPALA
jgi:hypothetical protein